MKISKSFSFDAAHRLTTHNGKCRNLHGHRYSVIVTIE
ncbi:6-carboxytetrahydropterin synthase [Patescibacteria group bacterium]|nr:6-carboxytetrahydropterin synthase [Patescibacteria group bacterium]MBP6086562.1 6-carboxytetrahydropterin synthase [Patescibacteria group bacterium]